MARRKRLTPAQDVSAKDPGQGPAPLPGAAPIAQVAGDAATVAALQDLGAELARARAEGRMAEDLPLDAIDDSYLMRDRLVQDEEEMAALRDSLFRRGQQTPIEVVALPEPKNGVAYGLISGWRRLTALRQMALDDPRFASVRARIVTPDSLQAAYVAMVEENEIRANLSHYERARIALRAVHEGIYPTRKAALQGLFVAVPRARRSKINSFIALVETLDRLLSFPTAIPEKLGLDLARGLAELPGLKTALFRALQARPVKTAEEELARLSATLEQVRAEGSRKEEARAAALFRELAERDRAGRDRADAGATAQDPAPMTRAQAATRLRGAVTARFDAAAQRIELRGAGVDATLFKAIQDFLKTR